MCPSLNMTPGSRDDPAAIEKQQECLKQRWTNHLEISREEDVSPEQAKALIDRLEIHYTPKHASWLNET